MSGAIRTGKIDAAIVMSSRWSTRPELRALGLLLTGAGLSLKIVSTVEDMFALLGDPANLAQCVIVDATPAVDAGDPRAAEAVASTIRRIREEHPTVVPIVTARAPSARLVSAVFRAGVADVVDPGADDDLTILRALDRASAESVRREARELRITDLQRLIEDFLRILVKIERRSIELEDALTPEEVEPDGDKIPRVLLVDDEPAVLELLTEMLTRAGMSALTADSGERAVDIAEGALKAKESFDLALVDKNLPGIDGMETIQRLRQLQPSLPIMIMTGYSTTDSAVDAVNLGVVGYVLKPFSDAQELGQRIKELASRYATERRERRMLGRIKQRHALFLERYQRIVADLARLKE